MIEVSFAETEKIENSIRQKLRLTSDSEVVLINLNEGNETERGADRKLTLSYNFIVEPGDSCSTQIPFGGKVTFLASLKPRGKRMGVEHWLSNDLVIDALVNEHSISISSSNLLN